MNDWKASASVTQAENGEKSKKEERTTKRSEDGRSRRDETVREKERQGKDEATRSKVLLS